MTVTLADRTKAARNNQTVFSNQVLAALVNQCRYQRDSEAGVAPGVTEATKAFAWDVLQSPDGYLFRFAIRIAIDPALDNVDSMDTIDDNTIKGRIEVIFADYAPEVPA